MSYPTHLGSQFENVHQSGRHTSGVLRIPTFDFECGMTLPDVRLAFEAWGALNEEKTNTVLVCHALTGDTNVAGHNGVPGWWSELVGPGRAIDTETHFVICANVLGGCSGSSGPSSTAPDGRPYGLRFPLVSIRDMVHAERLLVQAFGVQQVALVIGGSLGGMQAWEWAILAPAFVEHTVVIAAHAAFPPLAIGYNEAMRQAIVTDADWNGGDYYSTGRPPRAGLATARSIGMLTYRTHEMYQQRFGRRKRLETAEHAKSSIAFAEYEVEAYLRHHGEKLNQRFDANSYLYLTRAMDDHDIGRGRGSIERALRRVQSRLTLIGIPGDYLYDTADLRADADVAKQCGIDCQYKDLLSIHGHDAFLIEQQQLGEILVSVRGGDSK